MKLYIEYVVLDNIVFDSILIKILSQITKEKYSKYRVIFYLIFGVIFSLILPYFFRNKILSIVYRFLVAIFLVLILKKYNSVQAFVRSFIFFLVITFSLGGGIYAILSLFSINFSVNGLILYSEEIPLSILIILSIPIYRLIKVGFKLSFGKARLNNFIANIEIYDDGKMVNAKALIDSGNLIEINGKNVSIITLEILQKLHKEISINNLIFKDEIKSLKSTKYERLSGIGNSEKFLVFTVDEIRVNNEVFRSQLLAVSLHKLGEYDCILSNNFLEGNV